MLGYGCCVAMFCWCWAVLMLGTLLLCYEGVMQTNLSKWCRSCSAGQEYQHSTYQHLITTLLITCFSSIYKHQKQLGTCQLWILHYFLKIFNYYVVDKALTGGLYVPQQKTFWRMIDTYIEKNILFIRRTCQLNVLNFHHLWPFFSKSWPWC